MWLHPATGNRCRSCEGCVFVTVTTTDIVTRTLLFPVTFVTTSTTTVSSPSPLLSPLRSPLVAIPSTKGSRRPGLKRSSDRCDVSASRWTAQRQYRHRQSDDVGDNIGKENSHGNIYGNSNSLRSCPRACQQQWQLRRQRHWRLLWPRTRSAERALSATAPVSPARTPSPFGGRHLIPTSLRNGEGRN